MGRVILQDRGQVGPAARGPLGQKLIVAAAGDPLAGAQRQVDQVRGVAAHLAEDDPQIRLLPGAADGARRRPAREPVGHLIG